MDRNKIEIIWDRNRQDKQNRQDQDGQDSINRMNIRKQDGQDMTGQDGHVRKGPQYSPNERIKKIHSN